MNDTTTGILATSIGVTGLAAYSPKGLDFIFGKAFRAAYHRLKDDGTQIHNELEQSANQVINMGLAPKAQASTISNIEDIKVDEVVERMMKMWSGNPKAMKATIRKQWVYDQFLLRKPVVYKIMVVITALGIATLINGLTDKPTGADQKL